MKAFKVNLITTIYWILMLLVFMFFQTRALAGNTEGVLKIGVRKDCPPFSWEVDQKGRYRGYSLSLCEAIADRNNFDIEMVPVTAQNRFTKLHDGDIHILCEATTVTLQRMHRFNTTLYTFISGASLLYTPETQSASELKVGVLKGTTTENTIDTILKKQTDLRRKDLSYTRVELDSHLDYAEKFNSGDINLYIADREILLALRAMSSNKSKKLIVSRNYYTIEPYALFTGRNNHDLKYMADKTLARIFKRDIQELFRENFPQKRMNESLRLLFRLQQLLDGRDPLPDPKTKESDP